MTTNRRRGRFLASACLAYFPLLAGCGSSLPAPSEPGQARQIVTTSLDAWKRGEKPEALASSTPPVRVNAREGGDVYRLKNYETRGEPQPLGLNIQQSVALQLKDLKGKTIKKTINYVVTTGA